MRLVGYVRETFDAPDGESAFAQQELLRRYAVEHDHQLVAICQDVRHPGSAPTRDGYVSALGVIAAGGVDAILVPRVAALSSDAIVQEIMLWDLRARGIRVISTDPIDLDLLDAETTPAPDRLMIRDVLERVEEHTRDVGSRGVVSEMALPDPEVMVQIIASDETA